MKKSLLLAESVQRNSEEIVVFNGEEDFFTYSYRDLVVSLNSSKVFQSLIFTFCEQEFVLLSSGELLVVNIEETVEIEDEDFLKPVEAYLNLRRFMLEKYLF